MDVVRFLERRRVIQFFGVALILAPFCNITIQLFILNAKTGLSWRFISLSAYLMSGTWPQYLFALSSVVIGITMLGGSIKAWKFVLVLLGGYILFQMSQYKSNLWQSYWTWIAFITNLVAFVFVADQLVWKVAEITRPQILNKAKDHSQTEKVIHLKSYKKILFSFDSDQPWGRLETLTSEKLVVNCFQKAPESIEHKTIQIKFAKDVILDIKFHHKEDKLYYFKPVNITSADIAKLNSWLRKIAI